MHVTVDEVLAVIKTLQAKKSTPNILPGEVWKYVGAHLAAHLAVVVNHCLIMETSRMDGRARSLFLSEKAF
eukprot:5866567-Amphidinium_carterae.3